VRTLDYTLPLASYTTEVSLFISYSFNSRWPIAVFVIFAKCIIIAVGVICLWIVVSVYLLSVFIRIFFVSLRLLNWQQCGWFNWLKPPNETLAITAAMRSSGWPVQDGTFQATVNWVRVKHPQLVTRPQPAVDIFVGVKMTVTCWGGQNDCNILLHQTT